MSSGSSEDHIEWCGLVESKIRYLIGNLERNHYISLAHVNPRCFEHTNSEQKNENKTENNLVQLCSLWFIGLEFERSENLNVDLTENIQSFTDAVHKHAVSLINVFIFIL